MLCPRNLGSYQALFHAQLVVSPSRIMVGPNYMSGSTYSGKYGAEVIETAAKITAPGKGILAADESTGTIGKRVNTSSNKQKGGLA